VFSRSFGGQGGFMKSWNVLANETAVATAKANLEKNGFQVEIVDHGAAAKAKVESLIPAQAEVMNMTSVTLDSIGVAELINNSGQYQSVKNQLKTMDRQTQSLAMNKLGAAPEYAVGSVHAVTQTGQVVVVSNTGSQLPAYAYGSPHVIWVVGTQKIVQNLDEAMLRIQEYVLPLESERAKKAYGGAGSNISKILIFNKEINPERITIIFVKEALGF